MFFSHEFASALGRETTVMVCPCSVHETTLVLYCSLKFFLFILSLTIPGTCLEVFDLPLPSPTIWDVRMKPVGRDCYFENLRKVFVIFWNFKWKSSLINYTYINITTLALEVFIFTPHHLTLRPCLHSMSYTSPCNLLTTTILSDLLRQGANWTPHC